MSLIRTVLDFESAYGVHPETGFNYTLSKMSTEEYVRHQLFKAHGLGVKIERDNTFYVYGADMVHFLRTHPWDRTFAVAHHSAFDMAVLSWRCGIRPAFIGCTLSMANALIPHEAKSLANVAKVFGLGEKGKELIHFAGKWHLTDEEQAIMGGYCRNDVELTSDAFDAMKGRMPLDELRTIDLTIRMFTEPVIVVDRSVLIPEFIREKRTKRALMKKCGVDKSVLSSNDQFAGLLLSLGVDPPKKLSPSKVKDGRVDPDAAGEPPTGMLPTFKAPRGLSKEERAELKEAKNVYPWAYAFGKGDEEFKMLLDHPDPQVQAVVEARMGVKSTIKETRSKRFYKIGTRGPFPVYLTYYAAKTGRFGGGDKANAQNMTRVDPKDPTSGALRRSWTAPDGHVLVVRDLSQIECLEEDSEVLTLQRGYVRIQDIHKSDLLWDGLEWVTHGGVVFKGIKEVITYDGITATPDHRVFTSCGRKMRLDNAAAEGASLAIGEREGKPIRYVGGLSPSHSAGWKRNFSMVQMSRPQMRGSASSVRQGSPKWKVYKLRGTSPAESILRADAKESTYSTATEIQSHPGCYESGRYESGLCVLSPKGRSQSVQIMRRVCAVRMGTSSSRVLHRSGNRSSRQRRRLRARKFAAVDPRTECTKERPQYDGRLGRGENERTKICQGVLSEVPCNYGAGNVTKWSCSRNNNSASVQPTTRGIVAPKKVYDILNAGPRNRFTVNGKIVSNCRTIAYWAGQDDLLDLFRAGGDPYNRQASKIFGYEVNRKLPQFWLEGMVGKASTLGNVYQMGWGKFQASLRIGFMGMPPLLFDQSAALKLGADIDVFCMARSYNKNFPFLREEALSMKPLNVSEVDHLWHCAATKKIVDGFRASNSSIVALWKEMGNAFDEIIAGNRVQVGQRCEIYTCPEGLELPNGMKIYYPKLRRTSGGEYKYLSDAQRNVWERIYAGKGVENCIAKGTKVLTDSGWVAIENITLNHKVHDGVDFVHHQGIVCSGRQRCIAVDGVLMTPDHKVLANEKIWRRAEEVASSLDKLFRPNFRRSYRSSPVSFGRKKMVLGIPVPVREFSNQSRIRCDQGSKAGGHPKLRVPYRNTNVEGARQARYVASPSIRRMVVYASKMSAKVASCVEELWRTRDNCVRRMAGCVRKFLDGHGIYVHERAYFRQSRQQQGVQQRKLPLGVPNNAGEQHQKKYSTGNSGWKNDVETGGPTFWHRSDHYSVSNDAQLAAGQAVHSSRFFEQNVYDIVNCGPRRRFVVRGARGPLVVHNCNQALARIPLVDQMLAIEQRLQVRRLQDPGKIYKIVTTTHDEIVTCVPEYWAEECMAMMGEEMSRSKSWYSDMPLKSSGGFAKSYGECEK